MQVDVSKSKSQSATTFMNTSKHYTQASSGLHTWCLKISYHQNENMSLGLTKVPEPELKTIAPEDRPFAPKGNEKVFQISIFRMRTVSFKEGYIPSLNFSHHANMKITLHIVSSELRKGRFPFSPHECVVFEPRAGQPTPWVHDSPSFPCVPNRRYQRPPVQQGSLFSGLL